MWVITLSSIVPELKTNNNNNKSKLVLVIITVDRRYANCSSLNSGFKDGDTADALILFLYLSCYIFYGNSNKQVMNL